MQSSTYDSRALFKKLFLNYVIYLFFEFFSATLLNVTVVSLREIVLILTPPNPRLDRCLYHYNRCLLPTNLIASSLASRKSSSIFFFRTMWYSAKCVWFYYCRSVSCEIVFCYSFGFFFFRVRDRYYFRTRSRIHSTILLTSIQQCVIVLETLTTYCLILSRDHILSFL